MSETYREMLDKGIEELRENGIETAIQDAQALMQNVRGCDKAKLILNENEIVDEKNNKLFDSFIKKRMERLSVARIVGEKEFYGTKLEISKNVLEPRSDTECLIDLVIKHVDKNDELYFADLGCGSGAIVISLVNELKNAKALATDICDKALSVTKRNVQNHKFSNRIILRQGNWTECLQEEKFDFIVSNPPYVANKDVNGIDDPVIALDGGKDGLDVYRYLMKNAEKYLKFNGFLACEIGYNQMDSMSYLAEQYEWEIVDIAKDIQGHNRALIMKKIRLATR